MGHSKGQVRRSLAVTGALLFAFSAAAQTEPPRRPEARAIAHVIAPSGIATDPQGRVYVSSENRVYRLTPANPGGAALEIFAGNGQRGSLGDSGPAMAAQFDFTPEKRAPGITSLLAADSAGNLFIADTMNDTVRRVDAATGLISSVAGKWSLDASPAGVNDLIVQPAQIATDAVENLYIAGASLIIRRGAEMHHLSASSPGRGYIASLVASRQDGAIYLMSAERGAIWRGVFGGEQLQSLDIVARASAKDSSLSNALAGTPATMAADAAGNLFIAETNPGVIERLDAKTRALSLAAAIDAPGAMAFDREGNLFIADAANNAVLEIAGLGAAAPAGVTLTPNSAIFPAPTGMNPGPIEPIGGQSLAETFTLTNNTSGTLSTISVQVVGTNPGDFSQTSPCGSTLGPGLSCTVSVVFGPTQPGPRSAALQVNDSDPSSPQSANLQGTANDFNITADGTNPTTLTVNSGSSVTFDLALTPDATFAGSVMLACPVVGLPTQSTCTISAGGSTGSTATVTVTAGTVQKFTVTFATTKHQLAPPLSDERPAPNPTTRFPALLASAALLAFLIARSRRMPRLARAVAGITILAGIVVGGMAGCGYKRPKPFVGSQAGTYIMNVSASSTGNSTGGQPASRAFPVTLVIN